MPSANTGEVVSGLVLDRVVDEVDAIEDYNAVQERSDLPYWLTALVDRFPSVLRVFGVVHTR